MTASCISEYTQTFLTCCNDTTQQYDSVADREDNSHSSLNTLHYILLLLYPVLTSPASDYSHLRQNNTTATTIRGVELESGVSWSPGFGPEWESRVSLLKETLTPGPICFIGTCVILLQCNWLRCNLCYN